MQDGSGPVLTSAFPDHVVRWREGERLNHLFKDRCDRLAEQGLNPASFEEHLKAFEWGMPPHSGWGLGYDRLMMVLTGQQNVRDVVLYPMDTDRLTP